MDYLKQNLVSIVTLVVLVSSLLLGGNKAPVLGNVAAVDATNATNQRVFTRGVQIGTTATNRNLVSGLQFGSCALIVPGTIAATTTRNVDCAVTGVVSTDTVLSAVISSSTYSGSLITGSGGVIAISARASSTAGFITVTLLNLTGSTFTFAGTGFGSTTNYMILR